MSASVATLPPGARLGGRFIIEGIAGTGGMAIVYRARDEQTREVVAVKVLTAGLDATLPTLARLSSEEGRRFAREVAILSQLVDPRIARYVDRGSFDGTPYLVMQWVEGESLAERLRHGPMPVAEVLAFGRNLVGALVVVHELGIVHRDIKPSNIMLAEGRADRPILLDFGISNVAEEAPGETTEEGAILGTAAYMSPEQARGIRRIDARADVFSLGCVLFKCLTGRSPFQADSFQESLAKVLFEEAPPLERIVGGVPPDLVSLIARMLRKEVVERPLGAAAVQSELLRIRAETISRKGRSPSSVPTATRLSIDPAHRPLVTLVVVAPPEETRDEPTLVVDPDRADPAARPTGSFEERLLRHAATSGGRLQRLRTGPYLVMLEGYGNARDQAVRGAECALAIRAETPGATIAVTTGCAAVEDGLPVGEVVDRAVAMMILESLDARSERERDGGPVRLDAVTAGLIAERCNVDPGNRCHELWGMRDVDVLAADPSVPRGAFVGRRSVSARLAGLHRRCVSDSAPYVVLVTAPPGGGKSRFVSELVAQVRRGPSPPKIWFARGEMVETAPAVGVVAQLVRSALDLSAAGSHEAQRDQLEARLSRRLPPDVREHVGEFLSELLGAPVAADVASATLRAARQYQRLMGEHLQLALTELVEAEARDTPVWMVVDDAQWADAASLHLLRGVLRGASQVPVCWVGLARPEVRARFPGFWEATGATAIALAPLSRAASTALVTSLLGPEVSREVVARIVARAAGSPLYLEELARAVVQRRDETLPPTLMAMVQARLDDLSPDARRVLCAASVLGMVFWPEAIGALLGPHVAAESIRQQLQRLEAADLVGPRRGSRFRGASELVFRSDLLHESIYATLSADERRVAHGLAASWLERAGERTPLVLARHLELAGELGRALDHYADAAEQALALNDNDTCLDSVRRGAALGVAGEALGRLICCEGQIHAAHGRHAEAGKSAYEASRVFEPASTRWCEAATLWANATGSLGQRDEGREVARRILDVVARSEATLPGLRALVAAGQQLFLLGMFAEGEALVDAAEATRARLQPNVRADMLVSNLRGHQAAFAGDDGGRLTHFEAALGAAERTGDIRAACIFAVNSGSSRVELGDYPGAEPLLRRALALATRLRFHRIVLVARENLATLLAYRGDLDAARSLARELVAAAAGTNPRVEGMAHIALATVHFAGQALPAAEAEARVAAAMLEALLPLRPLAFGLLARVLVARGLVTEALVSAEAAMETIETLGHVESGEALVRLALAEALHASGRLSEAREVIAVARDRLLERAGTISNDALRSSFLGMVPENVATFRMAGALTSGPVPPRR